MRGDVENMYDLPRNVKQVHNLKYVKKKEDRRKNNMNDGNMYHQNLADHILNVERLVYSHPFGRNVTRNIIIIIIICRLVRLSFCTRMNKF